MQLINSRTNAVILTDLQIAESAFSRAWGLLGHKSLPDNEGLLLPKCAMVHMLFMRFAIDVVFCSKEDKVLHISQTLKPWRISRWVPSASYVIELAAGISEAKDIRIGDVLTITKT